MDVALYRGRGAEIVLVHASMRPPRRAEQCHGPLRFLDTTHVDANILAESWPEFTDHIQRHAFVVLDENDALRLLGREPVRPLRTSTHPG